MEVFDRVVMERPTLVDATTQGAWACSPWLRGWGNLGYSASKFRLCEYEACSTLGSSDKGIEPKGQSVWLMVRRMYGIECSLATEARQEARLPLWGTDEVLYLQQFSIAA